MPKYLVNITLQYNTETTPTAYELEELVYEDLYDLMRGDRLTTWAEITEE